MNLLPNPRSVELGERTTAHRVTSERTDGSLPPEGYELHITDAGAEIVAADAAGAFYARATLAQLARIHGGELPLGTVHDHPDLPVRAVMIDISRDKVPTMATLQALIDRLASWKYNQVQLYSEHTFAYANHAEVHAAASPLTAHEIRALDAFCRERHVELVPNQNCLGHMNRWLKHDRYRALALAPDGFVDPWGFTRAAMTLDPANPGTLALVRELLGELLPNFTSGRVQVGLDETWELPRERIGEYMEWIATLRALPELEGREMIIWGDIFSGDAELVAQVPASVTVCEWGYEASSPFAERTAVLAAAGVPFWVAPGTSSWLTIAGRLTNATTNCREAVEAALANGGVGFLVTDWGDSGHLQQLPVSEPALAYGAAVSWCLDANADIDLGAALSAHAFADPTGGLADALLVLGDAHRLLASQIPNHSILVMHLYYPQLRIGHGVLRGITAAELHAVEGEIARARAALAGARPTRADAARLVEEVEWTIDVLALMTDDALGRLAAGGDGSLGSVPPDVRAALAARLDDVRDRHRALWLGRNRPGGLADSAAWLDNLGAAYRSGAPDKAWGGWPAQFT